MRIATLAARGEQEHKQHRELFHRGGF
jgi:hypothetical protein